MTKYIVIISCEDCGEEAMGDPRTTPAQALDNAIATAEAIDFDFFNKLWHCRDCSRKQTAPVEI